MYSKSFSGEKYAHPEIQLAPINANSEVKRMFESAKLEKPAELPTNLSSL